MYYTIGEFANIARISSKTLRHYDKIGLFKPNHIDSSSGYRYYTEKQIKDMILIMELRSFDFSLKEIDGIIHHDDPKRVKDALIDKRERLEGEALRIKNLTEKIDARLGEISERNDITALHDYNDFQIKVFKERFVYFKRRVIDIYDEHKLASECVDDLIAMGMEHQEPHLGIYYYEDNVVDDYRNIDTEICVPVQKTKAAESDPKRFKTIPAGKYASTIHMGRFYDPDYNEDIDQVYFNMVRWIRDHAFDIVGVPVEIRWKSGHDPNDDESIIEITIPL